MASSRLKVFSLNCWTVPFISKDIGSRVEGIGNFLQDSDYDVVFLQEIWSTDSYKAIQMKCKQRLPYGRCFFSGRVGTSGLCMFSRFPIVATFYHPFMLNGYWYAIHHGDSHVGKGIALARIVVNSVTVNCFLVHLHAEYDRINDCYYAHRSSQAYELLKFADLIAPKSVGSRHSALSIIVGDLNLEPEDLGMRLLRSHGFKDTWMEIHGDKLGYTCDLPNNIYTPSSSAILAPDGKRIDYVLYRADDLNCQTVESSIIREEIAGGKIPLSDHEAVTATLDISPQENNAPRSQKDNDFNENDVLQELSSVFKTAIGQSEVYCKRWLYLSLFWILMGLIVVTMFPVMVNALTAPVYTALFIVIVTHYFINTRQEYVHLTEIAHSLAVDLESRKALQHSTSAL